MFDTTISRAFDPDLNPMTCLKRVSPEDLCGDPAIACDTDDGSPVCGQCNAEARAEDSLWARPMAWRPLNDRLDRVVIVSRGNPYDSSDATDAEVQAYARAIGAI